MGRKSPSKSVIIIRNCRPDLYENFYYVKKLWHIKTGSKSTNAEFLDALLKLALTEIKIPRILSY